MNQEQVEISHLLPCNTCDDLFRNVPHLPIPILVAQQTSVIFDNGVVDSNRWLSNERPTTHTHKDNINQFFSTLSDSKLNSSGEVVIGAKPYAPEVWPIEESEWSTLEDYVVSNEEKKTCILFMRKDQDNSATPLCSVNGDVHIHMLLVHVFSLYLFNRTN